MEALLFDDDLSRPWTAGQCWWHHAGSSKVHDWKQAKEARMLQKPQKRKYVRKHVKEALAAQAAAGACDSAGELGNSNANGKKRGRPLGSKNMKCRVKGGARFQAERKVQTTCFGAPK